MKRFPRTLLLLLILLAPLLSYGQDPITGTLAICVNGTTTLGNLTTGGTWSSSNTAIADVGSSSGIATGVASGTATITYTFPVSGFVTNVITVNAMPTAITGVAAICNTFSTTLSDTVTGGIWSTTSSRVTVGSATGVVTGVSTGTAQVTYTLPGSCRTTIIVTVNLQPTPITGTLNVCVGLTRALGNTVSGGTWTSSNTAAATFGTASVGIISGVSADTTTIRYSLSNGCFISSGFTVNPSPGTITGTFVLCAGSTAPLADTSLPGGTWTSSNITIAEIGTSSGIFHANSAGTARITYKTTGNCISTTVVTVNASPATITGTFSLCNGATTQLFNTVPLGSWVSDDTSVAVLVTPTGLVGGASAGTTTISYVLLNGCYRSRVVTVNPLPDTIVGANHVCTARTITLTSAPTGGTWSSSDVTRATAGTGSGIVTGVGAGSVVITYRLPTSCRRTHIVSVNTTPAAIAGTLTVCEGLTTALTTSSSGGSWVSSSTGTAIIASAAGVVTGIAGGTTTISYVNIANGCHTTATLTVNPLPTAITGAATVCVADTVILSSAATGGTWSSGATSIAIVGSASGVITGVAAGTVMITYRLPTGCIISRVMTVNPLPYGGAVTGSGSVCETGTTTLTPSVTGGTWSVASGLVSVSSAGVVTGLAGGVDTVLYNVTGGCGVAVVNYPIAINPLPDTATIAGSANVCLGHTTNLFSSPGGGTWSNSTTTAAVVSASGVVTGIALGTAVISYTRTNSCGPSVAMIIVTVHALVNPGTITGKDTTCMGDSVDLAATVPGGAWASTAPWIAGVNDTGRVLGSFPGTVTILYIVSNVCSTDTAIHAMYVRLPGECVTGIHTQDAAHTTSVKTYPNPTNGVLTIETPAEGNITIYTMEGKELQQYTINGKTGQITLPRNLAAGVYMCRFAGNDGSVVMTRVVYEP